MLLPIRWHHLAACLLASAALMGCDKGPIAVGFLGPLTGRYADLGVAGRDGARLAVEQLNQTGGINAHTVVLNEFDDQQPADALVSVRTQIAAAKLSGLVGPMTSGTAKQWIPMANALQLVTVSPTVTSNDFTGSDDYFFTVTSSTSEYASYSAKYYVEKAGLRRFSLLLDVANSAYSKSWSKFFRQQVQALGGQILSEQEFRSDDRNSLSQALMAALQTKPDGLVFVASAPDVAELAKLTRAQNTKLPLMAAEWAGSESVWKLAGNGLNGIRFSQFMNVLDDSDKAIHFRNQFKSRFGRMPGFAEFAGFDAMHALLSAMKQKQPTEPLKSAILRIKEFEGVQNPIRFDAYGDTRRPVFMVELIDGELKVLQ